jgi:flagellar protein FlbT
MPLKLVIKRGDKLVLNGAVIENVGNDAEILLHNQATVLRSRDILTAEDAATPASRTYFALQSAYMFATRREEFMTHFEECAREYLAAAPSAAKIVADVRAAIAADRLYPALKACQKLIEHEARLIGLYRRMTEVDDDLIEEVGEMPGKAPKAR